MSALILKRGRRSQKNDGADLPGWPTSALALGIRGNIAPPQTLRSACFCSCRQGWPSLGCRPDPRIISPPKGPFGILLLGRPALGVFGDVDVLLVYHRNGGARRECRTTRAGAHSAGTAKKGQESRASCGTGGAPDPGSTGNPRSHDGTKRLLKEKISAAVWSPPRVPSWVLGDVSLRYKKTNPCKKRSALHFKCNAGKCW